MSQTFEGINTSPVPQKPVVKRWQVSIKTMLLATAMIALLVGMLTIPELAAVSLFCVHVILVACCIVAAVSGRGWIRPFSILCGIYLIGAMFFLLGVNRIRPGEMAFSELVNLGIAMIVGTSGSVAHSYLVRRGGYVPVPNLPLLRDWMVNDIESAKTE